MGRRMMTMVRSFVFVALLGAGVVAPAIVHASGQASNPDTLCGCGTERCVQRDAQLIIDVTDRGSPACPANGSDARLVLRTADGEGNPLVFCAAGNGCNYVYNCTLGCECAGDPDTGLVPPLTESSLSGFFGNPAGSGNSMNWLAYRPLGSTVAGAVFGATSTAIVDRNCGPDQVLAHSISNPGATRGSRIEIAVTLGRNAGCQSTQLAFGGFELKQGTACAGILCGDGILDEPDEKCDDGTENGMPGKCPANCGMVTTPPPSDQDGDGVADSADRCPQTPSGTAVDATGCSLAQFCHSFEVVSAEGRRSCRRADWKNDEPLQ